LFGYIEHFGMFGYIEHFGNSKNFGHYISNNIIDKKLYNFYDKYINIEINNDHNDFYESNNPFFVIYILIKQKKKILNFISILYIISN